MAPSSAHPYDPSRPADQSKGLVSAFARYSGMILTACLCITFIIRHFVVQPLVRRFYGTRYTSLNERQQRGLLNHAVSLIIKIFLLLWTAYPFLAVKFTKLTFNSPYAPLNVDPITLTLGDAMAFANCLFVAMYLHELCYRKGLSPVAMLHHIGTVLIAQLALSLTVGHATQNVIGGREIAEEEFLICMLWGFFDVVVEGWPHLVMLIKRFYPSNHLRVRNWMRAACIGTGIGTFVETICIMWFFGDDWKVWTLGFKIATPILHVVFSAAQIWGTVNWYQMWRLEEKRLREPQRTDDSSVDPDVEKTASEASTTIVVMGPHQNSSKEFKET